MLPETAQLFSLATIFVVLCLNIFNVLWVSIVVVIYFRFINIILLFSPIFLKPTTVKLRQCFLTKTQRLVAQSNMVAQVVSEKKKKNVTER